MTEARLLGGTRRDPGSPFGPTHCARAGARMRPAEMVVLLFCALLGHAVTLQAQPPPGFKLAFIGDQGLGVQSQAVLQLIQDERTDAVVHSGDFDYNDDPAAWEQQIDAILGANFPYFACVGNHDIDRFYGAGGYQELLAARMNRLGIPWTGNLGVQSRFFYAGIDFVLVAPDVDGSGHETYIRDVFASSSSLWRVCSFHKNMHLMQPEGKSDETGWGVYEESRRAGAIIATGHAHAYSRTHLLSSMSQQTVRTSTSLLELTADDPGTVEDEGATFAFVSGLGGRGIRDQEVSGDWFASIYTGTQNAEYGALFAEFNLLGYPSVAHFYFKNIAGEIIDEFWVHSQVSPVVSDTGELGGSRHSMNMQAFARETSGAVVVYSLAEPTRVTLSIHDVRGRLVHVAFREIPQASGVHRWQWNPDLPSSGVYFFSLRTPSGRESARAVLIH